MSLSICGHKDFLVYYVSDLLFKHVCKEITGVTNLVTLKSLLVGKVNDFGIIVK